MIRLFENHRIRNIKELEGLWDFRKEDGKQYKLPVPGCWEQHPDMLAYRGKGEYSKKVYIDRTGNIRLEFKGVSHTADVYFDGVKIAHHYNAFTPFSAVVKNVEKGEHEIIVCVDNTFTEASALHIHNDYYTYGGITRPVALENISDVYVKYIHFTPYTKENKWYAKTEVVICNVSDNDIVTEINGNIENNKMSQNVTVEKNSEKTVVFENEFLDVKPWSNKEANLYMLNIVVSVDGEEVDDLIERVGFRTVEVKGKYIYVNGERVRLKGFNRHEDYAIDGCAVTLQHIIQDMDLMQDMGVNALRTCHYPNDERMLDLCDGRGIMVWEENHARGLTLKMMQNPNFERQCKDCIDEMIENHYNHPSIVIWGIMNECASETPEGREMYRKQFEQIKSLDKTRPTSFASCKYFEDLCFDLVDIVSMNVYSGWYTAEPVEIRMRKLIDWSRKVGGAGKPFFMTEFGAAAMYGYRDRSLCRWSEDYQAKLIGDTLEAYMNEYEISGVFIWQFADCRVTDEKTNEEDKWWSTRARCHNNKGIVDEYRRPKMSYDVVKEKFEKYWL